MAAMETSGQYQAIVGPTVPMAMCAPRNISHSAPQSPACTPPKNESNATAKSLDASKAHLLKRQVSFPADEFIVTGYLEPPIPWLKSKEMNSEDIIRAYKESCAKHGVTAIKSLLLQIKKIDNFDERYEELVLSGERLDPGQCEALEEIFKRVQFVNLQLKSCYLDDEASMALFDMLEFYEVATSLNISHNNAIATRGWHACSRMLKKTPCLDSLDASSTTLNEQCMPIICRALRLGSNLSILHLRNCGITGKTFVILVAALKMNTTVTELDLRDNKLTTTDGFQLGSLLRCNIKLKSLDLSSNTLQDSGISFGIEGLADQPVIPGEGLLSLILKNNSLSSNCMSAVGSALLKTTSLESLDLSRNDITNDGILNLKEGLMKNRSLIDLNLRSCKITCEGAVAIAEYIADNTFIQSIDLRDNDIRYGGCMALSLSMKVNNSITSLDLDLPEEIKTDENLWEYQQMFKDISNFCIRNKQMLKTKYDNNNSVTKSEDGDIVQNCDNFTLNTSTVDGELDKDDICTQVTDDNASSQNCSRFQVSRVQPNTHIPRYISGKINGRFKVYKVNASGEAANDDDEINSNDANETECPSSDSKVKTEMPLPKSELQPCVNSKIVDVHNIDKSESGESNDECNDSESTTNCLPTSPNYAKRRVTIDGGTMANVHKRFTNVMSRRKSTPSLGTNLSGMLRDNTVIRPSLKLTLNKQLEGLDLRSTIPLSPGRVVESCDNKSFDVMNMQCWVNY